jgi:hypothetical protein
MEPMKKSVSPPHERRHIPAPGKTASVTIGKFQAIEGFAWTTFVARGQIHLGDFLGAIHAFFPKLRFKDMIWDLSAASIDTMSRADFEAMICAVKGYESVRGYAKTVFVGKTPETFALVCMYTGLAAMAEIDVDYSAFLELEHAERWLICNRAHGCSRPGAGAKLHHCGEKACREILLFQAARKTNPKASITMHSS